MKKILFAAAAAALTMNAALWGQRITVTSPTAGANWCIGASCTVTWTKSGTMPDTVKIRLRRAGAPESEDSVWSISDDTSNDGSFGPVTVPASVPAGDYFVRVRTNSPDVIGDSDTFHVSTCAPASASITVTQPNGAEWARGNTYTIMWRKSGTMPDTVKIRLRRWGSPEAEDAIVNITDSTPNDGSSNPWTIPDTVPPGDYFIRVRTTRAPDVIGDSVKFKITGIQTFIPSLERLAFNDLALTSFGVALWGDHLVAHVKNQGTELIDRDVSFSVVFPEMVRDGAQQFTHHLYIPVDQERNISVMNLSENSIPLNRGLQVRVTIDGPLSQIPETNESNNTREARVAKLDIGCTVIRSTLQLSKLYMQGGDDFRVRFNINVCHNMSGTLRNVHVHWTLSGPNGGIMDYNRIIEEVPPQRDTIWHVDEKFGKQGRPNAHFPKLREGVTYRVTYGITDPGNDFYDVDPANDSDSFTFSFPD